MVLHLFSFPTRFPGDILNRRTSLRRVKNESANKRFRSKIKKLVGFFLSLPFLFFDRFEQKKKAESDNLSRQLVALFLENVTAGLLFCTFEG